jgi:DNA modification methylase
MVDTMQLPLNQIIHGNSIEEMSHLPAASMDLIFADPPYNLQLQGDLWRPNQTKVDAVDDDWDQFDSYQEYDQFTTAWLTEAQRLLKDKSSIWISGTYHNIFRVGAIMQKLGFWILNTITWFKPNAMPNFNGTRLKNDTEILIWAKKAETATYHFNYQLMKRFNQRKQLGSVWQIPICMGAERLTDENGNKLHSTQKPEELLRRILLASGKPGFIVLDPFSGTGTTAAVAKELHMQWIGIEREQTYIQPAIDRIAAKSARPPEDDLFKAFARGKPPRVAFSALLDVGYLKAGQTLYLDDPQYHAEIQASGHLRHNGADGSIHQLGKMLKQTQSCNGWKHWYYEDDAGKRRPIDHLRDQYRANELP